jgi:hypothetical protein
MDKTRVNKPVAAFQIIFFLSLFILYAVPSAGRFFYRDDFAGIFWSRIGSLGDLWRVIGQPLPGNVFYRPVGNVFYSLDWFLWGPNAFMYFFHSILWQLLSIYLIYKIVRLMTGNEYIAILSEILFLLYFPMNSGSVSLLSNRQAVMAITFCLLSFYYFFKMRQGRSGKSGPYLLSILFFALAVFTKELSVPLILVFAAADLLYFMPGKRLWLHYLPYFAVLILRYIAGVMAKVSLPFGGTVPDYRYIFGINIINNLIYYLSWLILPAVVVIATLYLLSLANRLKIDQYKAFPMNMSVFGLSFALINVLLYLPFAGYHQLGWLHMSTIGMAIFLASPTYYFLNLLSSKRSVKKSLISAAAVMIVFLIAISAVFLPSKLILRNRQAGYSKRFIRDFIKLNIEKDKKVYVVDIGSKDYRLSDTFVSPMAKTDVLYEAVYLFSGNKTPREIHLMDKAKDIGRTDAKTVILYYRDGKIFK